MVQFMHKYSLIKHYRKIFIIHQNLGPKYFHHRSVAHVTWPPFGSDALHDRYFETEVVSELFCDQYPRQDVCSTSRTLRHPHILDGIIRES